MVDFRRLFMGRAVPDDDDVPDTEGSSRLAIHRKRTALGGELQATVYCYAARCFLVSSIRCPPGTGLSLETGDPSVLPFDATNADLGRAVCEHLLRHDPREVPNLRDHKLTDWPVYKASRAKSGKSFESQSSRVGVATINLIIRLEAAPVRSADPNLCVKGSSNPVHEELGAAIRKVLNASDALREAGIL
jgi:hypothetical protein